MSYNCRYCLKNHYFPGGEISRSVVRAPENTAEALDAPLTLPCDHSFAHSTLAASISDSDFSLEDVGSTADGAMYMEVSFDCPRCGTPIQVELLESVLVSK